MKCQNCGKKFNLTENEINFYKSKNLELPKRCKKCRELNKERKEAAKTNIVENAFDLFKTRKSVLNKYQNKYPYTFKSQEELKNHFLKHGRELKCRSVKKYLKSANDVIANKKSLKKYTKDDNDLCFYNKKKGELVIISEKGLIRTFFYCDYASFNNK